MVTENVDIRFRESGARVIKRKIDAIGQSADRATHSIYLMRRSLWVLGGAGLVRGLINQIDTLTNYENRLKLTTTSAENLQDVQDGLFAVAKRSRSSFEGVADIYTRTALSARRLGISQKETLQFTESLSKATILSGASAREANAAMIQLGQGMASNRLSGDELRSVLEQLPYVADIIAQELTKMGKYGKVTRGELRKLGKEGQISAEVMFAAFRNAREEIQGAFAETVPTIGQAFSYLTTSWLQFLDAFKDSTGISEALANSIILIADNLDLLIYSALGAATALSAAFAGKALTKVYNYFKALREGAVRFAALRELEVARSKATIARVQAQNAANASEVASLRIGAAQLQQNIVIIQGERAKAAAYLATLTAVAENTGVTTGLTAAQTRLNQSTKALLVYQNALKGNAVQLSAAEGALAGSTNALAAANTRLAGATAAANTTQATMARRAPLLAGAVTAVRNAVLYLNAALLANPIIAIVTAISLITAAFIRWGNQIKVTSDGVIGLKDYVVAAFQLIGKAITTVINLFNVDFGPALNAAADAARGFGRDFFDVLFSIQGWAVDTATFVPRVIISGIAAIVAGLNTLPGAAAEAGQGMANALISAFEWAVNKAVAGFNKLIQGFNALASLGGFSGVGEIGEVSLSRFEGGATAGGVAAGEAAAEAFNSTMKGLEFGNLLGEADSAIKDQARSNLENKEKKSTLTTETDPSADGGAAGGGGKGGKGGGSKKTLSGLLAEYDKEIAALQKVGQERRIAEELIKIENKLKRDLTATEQGLVEAKIKELEVAKAQNSILESIIGPREEAILQQEALNSLFAQGKIAVQDYTVAIREMQKAADEASNSLFGGFRAAINDSIQTSQELGSAIGGEVVNAVDGLSDAFVNLAETGEFSVKELFRTLFTNLFKLAANQLFMSLLGSLIGIPGAGLAGGGFGGGGGLLGFASGGSIMPSGPGSTDTQTVAFNKRPDERVDILTPKQQADQKKGEDTIQPSTNLNVAVVLSEEDVVNSFGGDAGNTMIIKGIRRNKDAIRSVLSK